MIIELTLAALLNSTPTPSFHWNVPEVISEIDIPGTTKVPGGEVTLHSWYSKASRFALLKHFAASFDAAGFWIAPLPVKRKSALEPQLVAVDPSSLRVYSVLLLPARGAIAVTTQETVPTMNVGASATDLPLPPDASSVLVSSFESAQTVVFETRADPAALKKFFRDRMKENGFREESAGSFVAPNREVRVEVHAAKGTGQSHHVVMIDHQASSGGVP